MSMLIYVSIPLFLVTMLIEALWVRRARAEGRAVLGYERKDTLASLSMGMGNVAISAVAKLGSFALMTLLYRYRVVTLGTAWWVWVVLLFAEDFCYYWFHRAHHEVRVLWAAHVNHHSSERYNLSTALRQSWTTPITGPGFWMILPLLGFAPWMVFTQIAVSLLYQYWLHTEAIDRLGPLEWFMNTPSHHRVHHGTNPEYLDRNYAGVFIIWDRLFGTFEAERAPVVYGITHNLTTFRPVRIAFHEWRAVLRDAWRAPSFGAALGYLFRRPGWEPGGPGVAAPAPDPVRLTR